MSTLLLLPGDGIGPEVLTEACLILDALRVNHGLDVETQSDCLGGAAIDRYGVPLSDETLQRARESALVIMGSVGGPQWSVPYDKRPEQGLLNLRKGLGLYANIRPALCFEALTQASSLKPEYVEGLDLVIVRELIGGIYFSEPRGIATLPDGQRQGVNTQRYTTSEIHRIAHVAFRLARQRARRVCSVEKSNVMESGLLWREEVTTLHAQNYSDVTLTHMYSDNCAMQLVKNPKQFDVILTDNLFGDLLSDAAAMLMTINAERASRGLAPLAFDDRLCAIARSHAEDMVQRRYFGHSTPEGVSPFDRMNRAHYRFSYAGENIALDQNVAAAGNALWQSSEHRSNILEPHFERVGIAAVNSTDGEIFVVDFSD